MKNSLKFREIEISMHGRSKNRNMYLFYTRYASPWLHERTTLSSAFLILNLYTTISQGGVFSHHLIPSNIMLKR